MRYFNFFWQIIKWRMMFLTSRIWVLGTNCGYGEVLKEDAQYRRNRKEREKFLKEQGMALNEIRARMGL